jgi:hypothetical protein
LFIFVVLGKVRFESLCEFAAGQHNPSSTTFTFQPNICAQADNRPLVGATGMLLAKAQVIIQLKVGKHIGKCSFLHRNQ